MCFNVTQPLNVVFLELHRLIAISGSDKDNDTTTTTLEWALHYSSDDIAKKRVNTGNFKIKSLYGTLSLFFFVQFL